MKTLKKTLAALNNAELYGRESYSRPKTTTTYAPSTPDVVTLGPGENSDNDNVFFHDSYGYSSSCSCYEQWKSSLDNSISGWKQVARQNGYSDIKVYTTNGYYGSYNVQ